MKLNQLDLLFKIETQVARCAAALERLAEFFERCESSYNDPATSKLEVNA